MKNLKAFTLMEMLIVMTIMVIILGLGMSAYVTFTESTKFNEDVANIQSDILTMQRAAMLFKKDKDDGWAYGLGIDFDGVIPDGDNDGTYRFFKWCSGFNNYGSEQTSGPYPNFNGTDSDGMSTDSLHLDYSNTDCDGIIDTDFGKIVSLSGYSIGRFNLGDDVKIAKITDCGTGNTCYPRFLLFEAVTGRVFFFAGDGTMISTDNNMTIEFYKNFGENHELVIDVFSGNTTLNIMPPP